jgi:hypothetical protein
MVDIGGQRDLFRMICFVGSSARLTRGPVCFISNQGALPGYVEMKKLFAVAGLTVSFAALCGYGQTPAPDVKAAPRAIPRTAGGKPDFAGYWNIPYVPNMALGKEDSVPYTEAGRAAYVNHDSKDDPTSNCWFPGVPRIMQSPYPSQWVQTPSHLVILFEYMHTFRSIPLDGRPHPDKMEPAFMGDSTGH